MQPGVPSTCGAMGWRRRRRRRPRAGCRTPRAARGPRGRRSARQRAGRSGGRGRSRAHDLAVARTHAARPVGRGHRLSARGRHLAEPHRVAGRADEHLVLGHHEAPGATVAASGAGTTGPASAARHGRSSTRPVPACRRAPWRSTRTAGCCQSTRASSTVIFGASETPSCGCRTAAITRRRARHRRHEQAGSRTPTGAAAGRRWCRADRCSRPPCPAPDRCRAPPRTGRSWRR